MDKTRDMGPLSIRSLAPSYLSDEHGVYADMLLSAIRDKSSIRNIALTGPYGVGKSSILQRVVDVFPDDVVEVSLSTLGTGDPTETRKAPRGKAREREARELQREIVKQILYRLHPAKMPRSRFRRTAAVVVWREAGAALLAGAVFAVAATMFGWLTPLQNLMPDGATSYLGVAVAVAAFGSVWLAIRTALGGSFRLEKITAGAATVSVATKEDSYFDEFLDEIVYFFEVSGRRIVLFEDLDRYNNSAIFEDLRALNGTLNRADQLRRWRPSKRGLAAVWGRAQTLWTSHDGLKRLAALARPGSWRDLGPGPVRFIYAVKDSLFASLEEGHDQDAARRELGRSNRTKFFELVVPVVPFISHRNASGLLEAEFKGAVELPDPELLRAVAPHLAEMRLIKNFRTEYDVFYDRLVAAELSAPGISANIMFALVAYKQAHMREFEKIRLRDSELDRLHDAGRRMVAAAIERHRDAIVEATKKVEQSVPTSPAQAERWGAALVRIAEVFANAQTSNPLRTIDLFNLGQARYDREAICRPEFWDAVRAGSEYVEILGTDASGRRRVAYRATCDQIISGVVGAGGVSSLNEALARDQQKLIRTHEQAVEALRHATWELLLEHPSLTEQRSAPEGENSPREVPERTAAALADRAPEAAGDPTTFDRLIERYLSSDLARLLVRQGYLGEYFDVYSAIQQSAGMSVRALQYLMRNVNPGLSDWDYALEDDEIKTLLSVRGRGLLSENAAINLSIMNHVFASRDLDSDPVVKLLLRRGVTGFREFHRYLIEGAHGKRLVEAITPHWPGVFVAIADASDLTLEARARYLDYAFLEMSEGVEYEYSSELGALLRETLSTLNTPKFDWATSTRQAVTLICDAVGILPDVTIFGPTGQDVIRERGAFEVNARNLAVLVDSATISLDVLRHEPLVHQRARADLSHYVDAVRESKTTSYAIADPANFVEELQGLEPGEAFVALLALTPADCIVEDISQVSPELWTELGAAGRYALVVSNVAELLDASSDGSLDATICERIRAGEKVVHDVERDNARIVRVAYAILNAASVEALLRVDRVSRLGVTNLDPAGIIDGAGLMAAGLLEESIVPDDGVTLSGPLVEQWRDREGALRVSSYAPMNLSSSILPADHLAQFISSPVIGDGFKREAVASFGELLAGAKSAEVDEISRALVQSALVPGADAVQELVEHGLGEPMVVLELLGRSLETENVDGLHAVLSALGDPYAKLTRRGRPPVDLPRSLEVQTLLDRLVIDGLVSSYTERRASYRVNRRRG
ncbi:YobI family P-loop NTPase [Demequina sediminicola]|uniref:YobI family P-loop NTPase n=1 Tax=Demequina sediminicola TaxID=1095026 RepID=UPI000782A402|nr:hypothetical protein [Demequina sediminicola]